MGSEKTLGWVYVEDNLTVRMGEAGGCMCKPTPCPGTPRQSLPPASLVCHMAQGNFQALLRTSFHHLNSVSMALKLNAHEREAEEPAQSIYCFTLVQMPSTGAVMCGHGADHVLTEQKGR